MGLLRAQQRGTISSIKGNYCQWVRRPQDVLFVIHSWVPYRNRRKDPREQGATANELKRISQRPSRNKAWAKRVNNSKFPKTVKGPFQDTQSVLLYQFPLFLAQIISSLEDKNGRGRGGKARGRDSKGGGTRMAILHKSLLIIMVPKLRKQGSPNDRQEVIWLAGQQNCVIWRNIKIKRTSVDKL